jgi:electron transport complex protein RnfD
MISPPVHIHSRIERDRFFFDVLIALMPLLILAIGSYGTRFLLQIVALIPGAFAAFAASYWFLGRKLDVYDPVHSLTLLILLLSLPLSVSPVLVATGAFLALFIARELFGGTGSNFLNPAMFAWVMLAVTFPASFTGAMSTSIPFSHGWLTGVLPATGATPLVSGKIEIFSLLFQNNAGTPAELSFAAVLLGGFYLIVKRVITWQIPVGMFLGVCLATVSFTFETLTLTNLFFQLVVGGMPFAAFFVATDPVTSPVRGQSRMLYGLIVGLLIPVFRLHPFLSGGVAFAIVTANLITPFLKSPKLWRKI